MVLTPLQEQITGDKQTNILSDPKGNIVDKRKCIKPCDNLDSCRCIQHAHNSIYKYRRMQRTLRIEQIVLKQQNKQLDDQNKRLNRQHEEIMTNIQTAACILRKIRLTLRRERENARYRN